MKRYSAILAGWLVGLVVAVLRLTCRVRVHDDPRPHVAAMGPGFVFASLHSHQVAGVIAAPAGATAMVSRSADGSIIVPAIRVCGHTPIRGSSGPGRKGGATALQQMITRVRQGQPAMITVDGPRGPRGSVKPGAGLLARKGNVAVLPLLPIPTRRWILRSTWDRLQIPLPFSTIHVRMANPMVPAQDESLDDFAGRLGDALYQLERQWDPGEAQYSRLVE